MEDNKITTDVEQAPEKVEQKQEKDIQDKKKKRWFDLLLIFGILLVVGAGGALLLLEVNNEQSKDIYDNLKDQFVSTYPNQTTGADPDNSTEVDGNLTEEVTGEESTEASTEEPAGESTEASAGESTEASTETAGEASTEATTEAVTQAPTTGEPIEATTEAADAGPWYQMISVNFEGLRQINPDVIGWIHFETEDISYPILYSAEDGKYLRTDIYGNASTAGCIYVGDENAPGFDDRRVCIYGHNMKNLTMFGKLKYYVEKKDYYADRQYFQILEDGMIHRYQIFSFFPVNENETPMVRVSYGENDDVEFEFLLGQLKERSTWGKTGVEVNVDDHIITLVTCFTDGHRVLVNAVRVDSHPLN